MPFQYKEYKYFKMFRGAKAKGKGHGRFMRQNIKTGKISGNLSFPEAKKIFHNAKRNTIIGEIAIRKGITKTEARRRLTLYEQGKLSRDWIY